MYSMELVEGKDRPSHLGPKEFHDKGKTVGLLLRLTKPIWSKEKIVVMDSGFYVLNGLVELKKKGVFGHALIKKRRYWPKYIDGDEAAHHFDSKEVGDVNCRDGMLDGVHVRLFGMNDPDYTSLIMSTYGSTMPNESHKTRRKYVDRTDATCTKKFAYSTCYSNHFKYRGKVDDHNSRRHQPVSIKTMGKSRFRISFGCG